MTTNPGYGYQNLANNAQGLIGSGQPIQPTQGLIGAQPIQQIGQPLNRTQGINSAIDQVQAMAGHTGTGGSGIHGLIDKAQAFTGHVGPVGNVQGGHLNPTQGFIGTQQGYGQGTGLMNNAQGLIGGQPIQQIGQPFNSTQGINNTIDEVQAMAGHTGTGVSGVHGLIDKAQALTGHAGPIGNVQGGHLNPTQGVMGTQQMGYGQQGLIGGQPIQQGQMLNRAGGLNNTIDRVQGALGHTTQGGAGINGAIDRGQGYLGHIDHAGMH